jgi:hypothetical protein
MNNFLTTFQKSLLSAMEPREPEERIRKEMEIEQDFREENCS